MSFFFFIGYCAQKITIELLAEVSQLVLRKIMSFWYCNPKIVLFIRITYSQIKLGIPSHLVFPFRNKCQKKTLMCFISSAKDVSLFKGSIATVLI